MTRIDRYSELIYELGRIANALEALVFVSKSASTEELLTMVDSNVERVWHTNEEQIIVEEKLAKLGKVPHVGYSK